MAKKKIQDISRLLEIIQPKDQHGDPTISTWQRKIDDLFADKVFRKIVRNLINSKRPSSKQTKFLTALFELILEGEQREWDHKHINDLRRFARDYLLRKIAPEGAYFEEPFLSAIDCQRALLQRKVATREQARAKRDAFKNLLAILQQPGTLERARLALLGLSYGVNEVDEDLCAELEEVLDSVSSFPGIEGDYLFLTTRRWNRLRLETKRTPPFCLEPKKHSRLICVTSIKGGVGKSTVAATLAYCLARENKSVCIVEADTIGPAIMWQLDWPKSYFPSFEGKPFPFFHRLLLNKDFADVHLYLHPVTFPGRKKFGKVSLLIGSFRPSVVDRMEAFWQSRTGRVLQDEALSPAIEELSRILLKDEGFEHVILDLSPGIAGAASRTMKAVLTMKGSIVFVARSRAADIVTMALEAEGILGPMANLERAAMVINGIRPGTSKSLTDVNHLVKLLEAHRQILAYTEGFPHQKVREWISSSLRRVGIENSKTVDEVPELRFLNEPGHPKGLYSLFQDNTVRDKVVGPIYDLLKRFGAL